ncbi:MAG: hypothetical protein R3281_01350 [Balneolaceae bacterium]|nr:hypothetical protein [Balneolaceae bacterium]
MLYTNILKLVTALLVVLISLSVGCETSTEPPSEEKEEPYFKPGEYGGDPLEGTEHLYNLQGSPDGTKMVLTRAYTPGKPFAPRDQIWVLNNDGTNPKLIGYNFGGADWSPDGNKLAITFFPGAPYTYVFTVNLDSMKARQWTGFQNSFFSKRTASNPMWFPDNERMLISVWGKAYKQPYERGLYILNSADGSVQGPWWRLYRGDFLEMELIL